MTICEHCKKEIKPGEDHTYAPSWRVLLVQDLDAGQTIWPPFNGQYPGSPGYGRNYDRLAMNCRHAAITHAKHVWWEDWISIEEVIPTELFGDEPISVSVADPMPA